MHKAVFGEGKSIISSTTVEKWWFGLIWISQDLELVCKLKVSMVSCIIIYQIATSLLTLRLSIVEEIELRKPIIQLLKEKTIKKFQCLIKVLTLIIFTWPLNGQTLQETDALLQNDSSTSEELRKLHSKQLLQFIAVMMSSLFNLSLFFLLIDLVNKKIPSIIWSLKTLQPPAWLCMTISLS